MTQISHPQGDNDKLINGAMIKQLIMAGAFWSKKHFSELAKIDSPSTKQTIHILREARSAATQINDILQKACYEVSKCPSDSVKDILLAANQGARQAGASHQGRAFFYWFITLTRTLSDKQEISTQDLAQAMHEAANDMDRIRDRFTLEKDISSARRAAEAAMHAIATTQDIHKVLDKILEEIENFLDERGQMQRQEKSERMLIAMELTISTGLGLKFFFEGIKYYLKGHISLIDIKREIEQIEYSKKKISSLGKRPSDTANDILKKWMYDASVLLEEMALNETDDTELHANTKTVRELILSNDFESIYSMRDKICGLLSKLLAPKVYAPASNELAGDIAFTILNYIKPRQDNVFYFPTF